MKTLKLLPLFAFIALFAACDDDDDEVYTTLNGTDVPSEIVDYQTTHFPNNAIIKVVKEDENGLISYDAYLDGNFELDFDESYNITDIDGYTELPESVIPDSISAYVNENYPDYYITDWELELSYQQVELNNGLELEFEMDGTFIRVDKD